MIWFITGIAIMLYLLGILVGSVLAISFSDYRGPSVMDWLCVIFWPFLCIWLVLLILSNMIQDLSER